MKSLLMLLSTVTLVGITAPAAWAQCNGGASCSLPVVATATINPVARLSITSSATSLTAPKAADFGAASGVTTIGPTITVNSNSRYTLTASAANATWAGPSGTTKPAGDLKMKVGAGATVALGQVGTSTTGTTSTSYAISYNTIYNWTTDKPGSYSLVVNYTLTAP